MPKRKFLNTNNAKEIILPIFYALFILGLFVLSSIIVKNSIYKASQERLYAKFNSETGVLRKTIEDKLEKYSLLLQSARSLFYSSDEVTRTEWQNFANSLDFSVNYPSLTALAYVKKVPQSDINSFTENFKSETLIKNLELSNFKITLNLNSDEFYIINYIEPTNGNEAAFGYNIYSDETRRRALELARDTNSIVITEPVTLIQDTSNKKSFIMFLPVYKDEKQSNLEERRKNIEGFVIVALRASDLFSDVILSRSLVDITGLSIKDVTNGEIELISNMNALGSMPDTSLLRAPIVQTSRISYGTRTWQIDFKSNKTPEVQGVGLIAPYILFGLGTIISFLFAIIIINLSKTKERAENLARELTKDLEKFKLAVDNSSDHIIITDPDGNILYANDSVMRTTGFSREEVIGKKVGEKELWGGEMDAETLKKFWHRIKVEKKPFFGEFNNHKKNGDKYTAEANVSPVLNQDGDIIFYVGIERDVTKVKELERMKDEFVSVASHELRTPMTAIKGYTSMILEGDYGKLPKKMTEPLTDIVTSTERLINLVNDLLNLSRITAGRLKYNVETFKVLEVINDTVKLLTPIVQKKGLKLTLENSPDYEVFGDKDKLSQVLNNLIGNSIKFTDKGGITLTMKKDEDLLKIFITDTGIGIAKNDIDKIFQKFGQVSSAQTGKPQGTGLGLYISKQIANKLGGDIWIESTEPGKGSVFGYSMLLSKNPEVKKITETIAKESKIQPDQKEMS